MTFYCQKNIIDYENLIWENIFSDTNFAQYVFYAALAWKYLATLKTSQTSKPLGTSEVLDYQLPSSSSDNQLSPWLKL